MPTSIVYSRSGIINYGVAPITLEVPGTGVYQEVAPTGQPVPYVVPPADTSAGISGSFQTLAQVGQAAARAWVPASAGPVGIVGMAAASIIGNEQREAAEEEAVAQAQTARERIQEVTQQWATGFQELGTRFQEQQATFGGALAAQQATFGSRLAELSSQLQNRSQSFPTFNSPRGFQGGGEATFLSSPRLFRGKPVRRMWSWGVLT
jgi:hypothetical protein